MCACSSHIWFSFFAFLIYISFPCAYSYFTSVNNSLIPPSPRPLSMIGHPVQII